MKYPNWLGPENEGRVEALLNIVGEPNAEALLRDELEITFSPKAPSMLFDANGRRIPPRGLRARTCDPNRSFHLMQPDIDWAARLERIQSAFEIKGQIVSLTEFQARCEEALGRVQTTGKLANLARSVWLPVCIPQIQKADYGDELDSRFLVAVARAYETQFPDRQFSNYRSGQLAQQVKVVARSHQMLVDRLKDGPVCGVFFPNPLQGFSVHAQREQMSSLPKWILLGGGFDTGTAMATYPDVLARDFNTPGLDFAALQWQGPSHSFDFWAFDDWLVFDLRGDLGNPDDVFSGGLLVPG